MTFLNDKKYKGRILQPFFYLSEINNTKHIHQSTDQPINLLQLPKPAPTFGSIGIGPAAFEYRF